MTDENGMTCVPFSQVPRATYGEDGARQDRWITDEAIAWLNVNVGPGRWHTKEHEGRTVLAFSDSADADSFLAWAAR